MNQCIRTNKHEERNFSYNEWINEWIDTYEQINIKIKSLPEIKGTLMQIWKSLYMFVFL